MGVAELLAEGPYPPDVLADLQARAFLEYGNLLRLREDLDGAEAALATARRKLAAGTGSPLLSARLLDLAGSLFRAQRRFGDAVEALALAAGVYRSCGEPHLAGRSLLKAGMAESYAADSEQALRTFERALGLLDHRRDPALFLALVHNILIAQAETGQAEKAARTLWRVRALYDRHGTAADRVRLRWLEAKIALGLGQLDRAERLFRRTKAGFEQAEQLYVASIVGLDLAAVLLDLGRPAEVLSLVDEMLEVFRQLRIEREALVAVLLLRQALVQGEATAALARKVTAELWRLDLRPGALAPRGQA